MTMMGRRLELHEKLCELLGSRNVYFEPPATIRMKYPAIVYKRETIRNEFADNLVYKQDVAYQIVVIDQDPDSEFVEKVSKLPACRWNRHFESDNLNHDVFVIYF